MTSDTPPDPTSLRSDGGSWLLSCSPARSLVVRIDPEGPRVHKLFEQGSLAEAEQEAQLGWALAGHGVARVLSVGRDAQTGRPALVLEHCQGVDLLRYVEEHGPLPPRTVARIGQSLAAMIHEIATPRPSAPTGVVHRDIKPANLLWRRPDPTADGEAADLVLLDLEHATPIPAAANGEDPQQGFTGASHGFSPPESYRGGTPHHGFDIFAVGCTLHFLLTGRHAFRGHDARTLAAAVQNDRSVFAGRATAPDPATEPLLRWIRACVDPDPARRPDGPTLSRGLAEAAPCLPQERLATGTDARVPATLEPFEFPTDGDLLARIRLALQISARTALRLRRAPGRPDLLRRRGACLEAGMALLLALPEAIGDARRGARHELGLALIQRARRLVRALDLLGRLPLRDLDTEVSERPPQVLRDPESFFKAAQRDLETALRNHEQVLQKLAEAESKLDLRSAQVLVEECGKVYGGTSSTVSGFKDRVHRLDFYLGHLARLGPAVERLSDMLDTLGIHRPLDHLRDFLERCRTQRSSGGKDEAGIESLRNLRRSIGDLRSEFSSAGPVLEEAQNELEGALGEATDQAWGLLAEARAKLETPPIPIRPLQSLMHRLDHMRLAEMLVDRPGQPLLELLDEVEDVRLRLEQARSARDSLARGAQEAMDKGHLTTALYDIARAAEQYDDQDQEKTGRGGLSEQFEEAKQKKARIEDSTRRHFELSNEAAGLRGDPERRRSLLEILNQQEEILQYLRGSLEPERGQVFGEELQTVQAELIALESTLAEEQLDQAEGTKQRLGICERTLTTLRRHAPDDSWPTDASRQAHAVIQGWQQRCNDVADQLSDQAEAQRIRSAHAMSSRRRRNTLGGIAAVAVVLLALLLGPMLLQARGEVYGAPGLRRLQGLIVTAPEGADELCDALTDFAQAGRLPDEMAEAARYLLDTVRAGAETRAPTTWTLGLSRALRRYDQAIEGGLGLLASDPDGDELRMVLVTFGKGLHRTGRTQWAELEGRGDGTQLHAVNAELRHIGL